MTPGYQIRAKGEPFKPPPPPSPFLSTNSQRQKSVTHGASLSSLLVSSPRPFFSQPIRTHRSKKFRTHYFQVPYFLFLVQSAPGHNSQQNQIAFAWTAPSTTNRSLPPNLRHTTPLFVTNKKKHHYTISRTLSHTHKKEHTRFLLRPCLVISI